MTTTHPTPPTTPRRPIAAAARPRAPRRRTPTTATTARRLPRMLVVLALAAVITLVGARIVTLRATESAGIGAGDRGAVIPDGTSIPATDVDHPAIARLTPDLRSALASAVERARQDGIELRVTSGWRSREHQQRLYDAAVARSGDEGRRFVATPEASAHVRGAAVDIGPTDAAYWMQRNGAAFGLCQTFANEVWHYERRVEPGGTCPTPAADATDGG